MQIARNAHVHVKKNKLLVTLQTWEGLKKTYMMSTRVHAMSQSAKGWSCG